MATGVHNVKYGDTIWGIAKNILKNEGKEASNAEILKLVNLFAENSGRDPNKIYAGESIDLTLFNDPKAQKTENVDTVEFSTTASQTQDTAVATAQKTTKKTDQSDTKLYEAYLTKLKEVSDRVQEGFSVSGFEDTFAFVSKEYYNSNDTTLKGQLYKDAIEELAAGELKKYDTSGDLALNLTEYKEQQKDIYKLLFGGFMSSAELNNIFNSSEWLDKIENDFTIKDADGDGSLSKSELATAFAYSDFGTAFLSNGSSRSIKGYDGRISLTMQDRELREDEFSKLHNKFFSTAKTA